MGARSGASSLLPALWEETGLDVPRPVPLGRRSDPAMLVRFTDQSGQTSAPVVKRVEPVSHVRRPETDEHPFTCYAGGQDRHEL